MEQQPQNVVQATGAVADSVVRGLGSQPMLLGIVVLNCIGIGIAGYVGLKFLDSVSASDVAERQMLTDILTHNRGAFERLFQYCIDARVSPRERRDDRSAPDDGGSLLPKMTPGFKPT